MIYLAIKTALSALIIVAISEIGKRSPTFAALVASLPLVSLLGMIWLWQDTKDTERLASHAEATFWYVIPSLPMFLLIDPTQAEPNRLGRFEKASYPAP